MESNDAPWQYKPDGDDPAEADDNTADSSSSRQRRSAPATISWQAAEFIEHPHGAGWYGLLVLITAALTAAVYFVTKDYFATGTIPIVGFIVAVFAGHKPATASYEITSRGLSINDKHYTYGQFKSFSVLQEGSLNSLNLFPLKRFMPPVSAYFEPSQQDKIVNILGEYLPYEDRQMDSIDRLTRRLRL